MPFEYSMHVVKNGVVIVISVVDNVGVVSLLLFLLLHKIEAIAIVVPHPSRSVGTVDAAIERHRFAVLRCSSMYRRRRSRSNPPSDSCHPRVKGSTKSSHV